MDFLTRLFDTSDFPPRWHCGNWSPGHGWLHILSDLGVWSAYVAIPFVLIYFLLRRKDLPFRMIFLLFGAFILACGTTHLMEAIIFWWPAYRLAGVIKLLTAIVSWATVFALVQVFPKALTLRSPEALEREIKARLTAEQALKQANDNLEIRIRERTEELAKAKEQTQELLEIHQAVMASMGEGLYAVDSRGLVTYMNPAAEALFGWTMAELLGRRMHDVTHYKHLDGTPFPIEECSGFQVFHQGTPLKDYEDYFIRKDETFFPVSYCSSPLRSHGKTTGLVVVFHETTERRKRENALKENQERLAEEMTAMQRLQELVARLLVCHELPAALDQVLDAAITLVGADMGNIRLLNPQNNLLEIAAQRGFSQRFLEHFRGVSVDDKTACGRAMKNGERIIIEDAQTDVGFAPHLQIVMLENMHGVQSTPLIGRDGKLLGMLSTHFHKPYRPPERNLQILDLYARQAVDFIERIRMEETLREADRHKDEFLATLAHELRNPLAPVRNSLEIIKRMHEDPRLVEQARNTMERQVGQMVRLIDDLLDVSRISRNRISLRIEQVELASIIQHAVEACRPLADGANHELNVSLPSEPIYLNADSVRLTQVFGNLLTNACKYTERGGRIGLIVERAGNEVIVKVKDTGVGISPEMLPKVFEMFTQIDRSLERTQGGLGIGLALVKRLVDMHGGTVSAHSEGLGRGSEFVVRLPILLETPKITPKVEPAGKSIPTAARRILVVDDNKDAAITLAMLLKVTGNDTQMAYDGLQAVEVAMAYRPNVILLDIGLPHMNGYDVCRAIRKQPWGKDVLIVALTGWGQEEDRRKSKEAGFNVHLVKPVDHAELMKLLAETKVGNSA